MNYDLVVLLDYLIGAFACCFGSYMTARILLEKKCNTKVIYQIAFLICMAIITIINSLVFDSIIKVFGTLLVIFCIYYFLYKEKLSNSFVLMFLTLAIMVLGETTFALIASLITLVFKIDVMTGVLIKSCIINIVIVLFTIMFCYAFRKLIRKLIEKIKENNTIFVSILGFIVILVGFSSLYNLFESKLKLDYLFILNVIIVFGCFSLMFILIKQKLKNKEILDKYILLEEYLKTSATLIENDNTTIHKYKNNLIILKGYLKTDVKAAIKYLDSLLEKYESKKYNWLKQTNYINIETIKYLIYYKLSKAEQLNLNIVVLVSEEIKKIKNNLLKQNELSVILDILGEYFDNAIYASNESKEKEIIFDLHKEDNNLVFTISNTYKGEIDLNLITKNGYTTKGKGHGFGLYDIDKVIKMNKSLDYKYEVIDNYFSVTLYIKI